MSDTIIAQPTKFKPKLSYALSVALVTPIGLLPGVFVMLFVKFSVYHDQPAPIYLAVLILLASLVPGFLFGLWFAKKEVNRMRWQLTDTELSCGAFEKKTFPLSSIEKIIVGLPQTNDVLKTFQRATPGTTLGTAVDVLSTIQPSYNLVRNLAVLGAIKENSLLICFKDGSWLPLRLFGLPNGRALMDELRERCEDRVVESYDFSPDELQRLRRRRDANGLIPAPKASTLTL